MIRGTSWLSVFRTSPLGAAIAMAACSTGGSTPAGVEDAGTDLGTPLDGGPAPTDAAADTTPDAALALDAGFDAFALNDAGLTPYCQAYSNWATTCGEPQILCDGGAPPYASLCQAYDESVNSAAYRQAELGCLTAQNCDINVRLDCDDRALAGSQPTAMQLRLVADYCATCAPGNATCVTSSLAYDADAGPMATPIIFNFGWEFSDSVTSQIDTACTGAALDAGAGACVQAFGNCALTTLNAVPQAHAFVTCM